MLLRFFKNLFFCDSKSEEKEESLTKEDVLNNIANDIDLSDSIHRTVNQRLADNITATDQARESAVKAFSHFTPTRIGAQADQTVKSRLGYVANDEEFEQVQESVVTTGVDSVRANENYKKGIEVGLSDDLKDRWEINEESLDGVEVNFGDAWKVMEDALPGYDFSKGQSALDQCAKTVLAKAITERIIDKRVTSEQGTEKGEEASIASSEEQPEQALIEKTSSLINTMTLPENKVQYGVVDRAQQTDVDQVTSSFSLRPGPADVTAFHDFYDLQIAFQHVWAEVFDKELKVLGSLLYLALVDWRNELGVKTDVDTVSSIDELRQVMADVRNAALQIAEQDPRLKRVIQLVPELTPEVWSRLSETQRSALFDLAYHKNLVSHFVKAAPLPENQEAARAIIRAAELTPKKQSRVEKTLADLEQRLSDKYRFDVFYANPDSHKYSINFGILVNYRQRWQPISYQVGELVSTIPLAPKEVRKYTTRQVVKKSRAEKEIESALQVRRQDSTETSRSHSEIVRRANNKTNFKHTAEGGVNFTVWNAKGSDGVSIDSAKQSAQTKKEFREAVLKAAEEYKNDHRIELSTSESEESIETTSGEISNPNDELPVTYLFYELQRRFEVSEQIHKITPVVMVANKVPRPDEIDEDWLLAHDWILRRVILDDSFLPALDYLSESFVGDEIASNVQRENLYAQLRIMERISRQIYSSNTALQRARSSLDQAIKKYADTQADESSGGLFGFVGSLLFGGSTDYSETYRIQMEAAREAFERAERERQQLSSQMETEVSALQHATDKYSQVLQDQMNRRTEILRLRAHVKDNIIYYMQAIWDQEPADQRFFRLYDVELLDITGHLASTVTLQASTQNPFDKVLKGISAQLPSATFKTTIPSNINYTKRKLVEVADLDNLLGYKGNYMIFPLKRNNPITLYMMQDYLRLDETLQVKDPDALGNFTIEELQAMLQCLFETDREAYERVKPQIEALVLKKLSHPHREKDVVIVPSGSLYIEALPGTHPILEDFKLIHRAVDVKKVQAEVRQDELENLRMAARTLEGDYEDPDIERKIVVEGATSAVNVNADG